MPDTELRARLRRTAARPADLHLLPVRLRSYLAYRVLTGSPTLSGGMTTYHGFHCTPLRTDEGRIPVVPYAEAELARRPGALDHS